MLIIYRELFSQIIDATRNAKTLTLTTMRLTLLKYIGCITKALLVRRRAHMVCVADEHLEVIVEFLFDNKQLSFDMEKPPILRDNFKMSVDVSRLTK